MKKLIGTSLITLSLLGGPAVAFADAHMSSHGKRRIAAHHQSSRGAAHAAKWRRWHHEKGLAATPVPELDPSAAGQGLALLLAATALLVERRRRTAGV